MAPDMSVRDRIRALGPWFHNMELRGVMTAPDHFLGDYPRCKWQGFAHALPADLGGRSVLDIGCNAGFYSLELKRRGAGRVLGIDTEVRYLQQAALASEMLGLPIELRPVSVYQVAELRERFDLVLFMDVLHHLRHPLLALDLIRAHVARDLMVCQCLQRGTGTIAPLQQDYPFDETALFTDDAMPRMQFIEHRFAGDPTNWWIPNRACVAAMLRSAGFVIDHQPEPEIYICRCGDPAPPLPETLAQPIG